MPAVGKLTSRRFSTVGYRQAVYKSISGKQRLVTVRFSPKADIRQHIKHVCFATNGAKIILVESPIGLLATSLCSSLATTCSGIAMILASAPDFFAEDTPAH